MRLRFFILGIKTRGCICCKEAGARKRSRFSFQFYFEGQTRRQRANDADSAICTARSSGGRQRSFTDEMGLKLCLIDRAEDTRVTGSRGVRQIGTLSMQRLLGKPGKGDRLQPICAYPQCVSELDAALGEGCIQAAH